MDGATHGPNLSRPLRNQSFETRTHFGPHSSPPLHPLYYGGMGYKIVYPGYKLFIEKYPSEVCSKYFFETY